MTLQCSLRHRPDLFHRSFEIGLLLKGIYAAVELGTAAIFWLVKPEILGAWLQTLTTSELAEDPHDLIGNWILHAGGHYSTDAQHFAIYYLLCHGLVKLGLVLLLWRGKPRSYPIAVGILAVFVVYLGIRWSQTHAVILVPLVGLDLVMICLVMREYLRIGMVSAKPL